MRRTECARRAALVPIDPLAGVEHVRGAAERVRGPVVANHGAVRVIVGHLDRRDRGDVFPADRQ